MTTFSHSPVQSSCSASLREGGPSTGCRGLFPTVCTVNTKLKLRQFRIVVHVLAIRTGSLFCSWPDCNSSERSRKSRTLARETRPYTELSAGLPNWQTIDAVRRIEQYRFLAAIVCESGVDTVDHPSIMFCVHFPGPRPY